jgi:RHS repeat-associated protein
MSIDKFGNLVVSYYYDAWGSNLTKFFFKYGTANNKNSYTVMLGSTTYTAQDIDNLNSHYYRSYYLDKETGFYYLITRYYDPEVGRFISPDDPKYLDFQVAYGHNRYAYCNNNPVMGYDPMGTDAVLVTDYSLPSVGHAIVYIQDENGVWYKTDFNPNGFYISGAGKVSFREATSQEIEKYILGKEQNRVFRFKGYEKTRLYGDFSGSFLLAKIYYENQNFGNYNLFTNNCQDYANEILSAGDSSDSVTDNILYDMDVSNSISIPFIDNTIVRVAQKISNIVNRIEKRINNMYNRIKSLWSILFG